MSAINSAGAAEAAKQAAVDRPSAKLGEILVSEGVIDESALSRALAVQQIGGRRLGTILIDLKLCTEDAIRQALAKQLRIEVVDLAGLDPDPAAVEMLSLDLIRKYEAIPLRKDDDRLWVAMTDPYNAQAIEDIREDAGVDTLTVAACTEQSFARFVRERLGTQSLIQEIIAGGDFYARAIQSLNVGEVEFTDTGSFAVSDLRLEAKQAPIVTFCNFLLVEAIKQRASDIHLEPYEHFVRVRLRVDGYMHTLITPPRRLHEPMVSRLKIMANLDISRKSAPQDGHISIMHAGQPVHFRMSTLPTVYGEKCVIRLLQREHSLSKLESLGMEPADFQAIKSALQMPQGMILATGPTGSGKTTTLHAGLSEISNDELNIVTLEDPVESTIPGVNHVQINEKAGISFASGLRSVLRQDPDVVFVGEMRDAEVAGIAIKAALTGHLVLSTLHTNSASETLVRLEDMGIPSYLLADALLAIVAQRLLRRVCPTCAVAQEPTDEDLEALHFGGARVPSTILRRGRGCSSCMSSGYRGRLAVYEFLHVTEEIRGLIRRAAPANEIAGAAARSGMVRLYRAGLRKVAQNATTLEEVERVLYRANETASSGAGLGPPEPDFPAASAPFP